MIKAHPNPTVSPTIRGILLLLLLVEGREVTPLLTTLEEVTENPPRDELEEVSPAVSAEDAAATLDVEAVGGVAVPTMTTDPTLILLNVIASTRSALIPKIDNSAATIVSMLFSTAATSLAPRAILKPTFTLL